MHIEQRVDKSIGWPRDVYLFSSLYFRNFAQITIFSPRNLHVCGLHRKSYRDRKHIFSNYIFTNSSTSRKKGTNWWCSWRDLKTYSFICSEYIKWWKPPKRYQNGGTFRVHCCLVCNLDDKRSLLRGMTGDDHTLTFLYIFILFLPFFDFDLDIVCFVLSFLVGNMLSPRFRFLPRFV